MKFVVCVNCGKTMPKQVSGIELLDNMEPEKVWCSEWCLQKWEERQKMREIKFRGKRLDNGEWVYGGIYTLEDSVFIVTAYGDRHYIKDGSFYCSLNGYEVDPATVGEFTGLKDKNGKEIYEGDIVNKEDAMNGHRNGVVRYVDSGFAVFCECGDKLDYNNQPKEMLNLAKVIGNIHENPELLKT